AIAVNRISPASLPIGRKCLGDHLFSCYLFEDLKLCRRRFTYIFGRILVVRIRRVLDVSHTCNNTAFLRHWQTMVVGDWKMNLSAVREKLTQVIQFPFASTDRF